MLFGQMDQSLVKESQKQLSIGKIKLSTYKKTKVFFLVKIKKSLLQNYKQF